MRRLGWIALLVCSPASADQPGGETGDESGNALVRAPSRWQPDGPLLHFDAGRPALAEGLGVDEEREERVIELIPHARLAIGGRWWKSGTGYDLDPGARGWSAGGELSYDLGLFRIVASATESHVDSRFERGAYRDLGLSISRTVQLTPSVQGWAAVGINARRWIGTPPLGEANATTLMFRLGASWR